MNRFRAWGTAVALALGAAAPAVAVEPQMVGTDNRPWYKRMFFAPKPAGPVVRGGPVVAAPGQPPIGATLSPDAVQAAWKAESDAYLRRLDVCVALRQAALDRNDDALMRQVDELERQADALYKQRMAALGVSRAVRAPLPAPPGAGFAASFDLAPEKPADPKAAAARLVAPAAPVPVGGSTAEVREVKP
jgi:hypothetical protein